MMEVFKQSEWYFASSDLYQMLGLFMTQTSPSLAQALYSGALSQDVECILHELGYAKDEIDHMASGFEEARSKAASETELFHAVRKDYTHLFSNPTFSAMTPFESRMSGPDKEARGNQVFFGRTIPSARSIYRRVGFESSITPRLREDHAAVELEFMQMLRRNQGIALREGHDDAFKEITQTVDDFTTKHIGRWAVSFFMDVEQNAQEDAYRAIGRIGMRFVRDDVTKQHVCALA